MPEDRRLRGLRVLMTADAVGGVFNYALNLAAELCRRGSSVTIACMGPPPSAEQRAEAERIPGLRLLSGDFALEWADNAWPDVDRAGDWLLSVARDTRPDLIHLNGFTHASLPWPAPVLIVAHSCVQSWWRAVFGTNAPPQYDIYRQRVRQGLHAAQAVVAPSASLLAALYSCYGQFEHATVIPNGVPLAQYFPRPKRQFFLAAGRVWDEAKNLRLVAKAAPALPWPVAVAGDGALSELGGCLQHLGRLPSKRLAQLMSEAPVFLHPARYEPFGLAPLEAALSGAALVLGAIDSLQEIWGDCALYVSPDDASELQRAATRLADDPVLRHGLAKRAQRRGRAFSLDLMTDRYTALYRALLGSAVHGTAFHDPPPAVQAEA